MVQVLQVYTAEGGHAKGHWMVASVAVAKVWGKHLTCAHALCKWCHTFIKDHHTLPKNQYGSWNTSVLHTDKDLKDEIMTYLQAIGKFISANDVIKCVSQPHMLEHLHWKTPISVATACQWMKLMGYQWQKELKGQYVDGHEHEDVVNY